MERLVFLIFTICIFGIESFALGENSNIVNNQPNTLNSMPNNTPDAVAPSNTVPNNSVPTLTMAELELQLQGVAKGMNQKLPMMVDKITRLERVDVNKNVVTYNYTVINMTKTQMGANFSMFESALKSGVTNNVCANPTIVNLLDMGAILEYTYNGSDNMFMTKFRVAKSNCK